MEMIGRWMMLAGGLLFIAGGLVYLTARFGLSLGRLPGDILIQGENGSFYFPLASSILVSVLLTILLNLIARFWPK